MIEDGDSLELRFTGEIWYWRGPAPFYFITVPDEASAAVRTIASLVTYGWGMVPVRARIGATDFSTAMFPKDGLYVLPVKDKVRLAEGLGDGDTVAVELSIGT
jgi:hypothetical protein